MQIKDSRDESGRFSGVFSSSGSPRLGVSRSSSRLSMQDDTDDADFPFAVDDVDPDSRPGYALDCTLFFNLCWNISAQLFLHMLTEFLCFSLSVLNNKYILYLFSLLTSKFC